MSERGVWIMTQEQNFLAALARDDMDELTRNVYADWLDEHDRPEEANRQRKWCESRRWIESFAERFGNDYDDGRRLVTPMTYDRLMQAATDYAESGDYTTQHGATDWQDIDMSEFWSHYEVVTGKKVSVTFDNPFTCSC